MSALYVVLGYVALQRLAELLFAARNTSRLRASGAIEIDARYYPCFVALHAAWWASLLWFVPADAEPVWPLLIVFALLQPLRLWVIASLGRRWTTRLIVLPGAALVERGPYRYWRHPNYAIVVAEIALLPLAFAASGIAVLFSALNLILVGRRIALEEQALAAAKPT